MLKLFGQLLRTNFRKEDVIGRIGGDEFVVLLKNLTAKEETNAHIEHLISEIRDHILYQIIKIYIFIKNSRFIFLGNVAVFLIYLSLHPHFLPVFLNIT